MSKRSAALVEWWDFGLGKQRRSGWAWLARGAWILLVLMTAAPRAAETNAPARMGTLLPEAVSDPLEPVNRFLWDVNRAAMIGVVQPSGKVYRALVVKPVRTGIANVGRNLTYPARLMNHLFQARWKGAEDETGRFLCNSIFGLGGFFDAGTRCEIPKSDADAGQSFGSWGWNPHAFLMLPIYGPSNERDALGLVADAAMNPLTYFSPYSYASSGFAYNGLTENVDDYVRLVKSQKDPYAELELVHPWLRTTQAPNFQVDGPQDAATLETLRFLFVRPSTQEFLRQAQNRSVLIPKVNRKLRFSAWMQPKPAPLSYLIPGLGSHRLTSASLALAEKLFATGQSVVCLSNPFSYEFMESASSTGIPAYVPVDIHDLQVALTEIDRSVRQGKHPVSQRSVIGYSMGAFEALVLAAVQKDAGADIVRFDRFVAINPPVRLLHGVAKLDEFYQAPMDWPDAERTNRLRNTFLKVAALRSAPPSTNTPPFSAVESRFLIGLNFRLILRDLIVSSQERHNLGLLKEPIRHYHRRELYREILQYSYVDYFEKFVIPYYESTGVKLTHEMVDRAGDLRTYSEALRKDPNVHVLHNRNDFLLSDSDRQWLEETFDAKRLTFFEHGGHLGNLGTPELQEAVVQAVRSK